MGEFEDLRKVIGEARNRRERLSHDLFAALEGGRKIQRRLDLLSRSRAPEAREITALRRQAAALGETATRLGRELDHSLVEERAAVAGFGRFSDPRENIGRLDDRIPILLFPVRLETRFKAGQLWVRVYPDDIAVDTFEDLLAETEVRNAKAYWTHIWKAGGVEGERRAAWRTLAASHGAGRANWILQQLQPLNPGEEPVKAAGEHLLVVASDDPLPAAERPAVAVYWREVWLAHGDATGIDDAFAALAGALGNARATTIVQRYVPANLEERPAGAVGDVRVVFLELPADDQVETQQQPWGRPARARVLPDRFVLLGYNDGVKVLEAVGRPIPADLTLSPDPGAGPGAQLRVEDGVLIVPEPMRWTVDFEEALDKGMAFRIDLDPVLARGGFDQLLVLGVRLAAGVEESTSQLETLFRHHQASRKGLTIALQGTPTNNTEADASGYSWREDPDVSYDHFFGSPAADDPTDWRRKRDGRWLAELLGIDPAVARGSVNYFGQDQADARAMQLALWPATLGYFTDRMMGPVFDDPTIEATRAFFTRFVSGRGAIPAVRVGAQPYGILPATAYSRMRWMHRLRPRDPIGAAGGPAPPSFLARLYGLLQVADQDWTTLSSRVSVVGGSGDPHQILLDVLGLHPTSAEFYHRYAQSREQLLNQFRYHGAGGAFLAALIAAGYTQSGMDLLQRLGYQSEEVPEILSQFFLSSADRLDGPLVDDRPLSESERLRSYRENGDNYLHWLIEAARTSHDALRRQEGFQDGRPPTALLYLMLRHALDLSYLDVSLALHVRADLMTASQAKAARADPRFIHVRASEADAGSPWQYLYKAEPAITAHPDRPIGAHVPTILTVERPYLQIQLEALEQLAGVPTARLERAFVEHLDCCAYRLDAWWLGLVHAQLAAMRGLSDDGPAAARRGSHLGAFGWLEEVRPEHKALQPVRLPPELVTAFERPGEPPLTRDPSNGGHILAPSLNHAVTAAVLRNGYISNARPEDPDALAVNLTSARVRLALGMIEGIRAGQTLGALLGYQLERGLHDQPSLFLDDVIVDLRTAFPLVANKTGDTAPPGDVAIESLEARNVVDGLALVEKIQQTGVRTYPFGVAELPPIADDTRRGAVGREVERLLDIADAVSDLALAESVHQVVQGNYDRAAGTFDAYSKGNFPPLPDVVQTPRSGVTLTHRVALHLEAGLDPADPALTTPRARGEPAVNRWLESVLPDPDDVVCQVAFFDRVAGAVVTPTITAAELGLLPIDLLYLVTLDRAQAMTALDDTILHHVATVLTPRVDSAIEIRYTEPVADKVTFFELAPLVRSLRTCLLRSRPLRLTDLRLQGEARKAEDASARIDTEKIAEARTALQGALGTWNGVVASLGTTLSGPDEATIVGNAARDIDDRIGEFIGAARSLSLFGLPNAGIGSSLEWRRAQFAAAMAKLDELVGRWLDKLTTYELLLDDYNALDPLTPDPDRIARLAAMERVLSTGPEQPPQATPLLFLARLNGVVRPAFDGVLVQLESILGSHDDLHVLHQDLEALGLQIDEHDAVGLDLTPERREIRRYTADLLSRAEATEADITGRIARADQLLADSATALPDKRIQAITEAARTLLDPDFAILPEFTIPGDFAAEAQSAWDHRAELLDYVRADLEKDFPVDDWLYGMARVREKMGQLESGIMLMDALSGHQPALDPLQFPYRPDDVWLGLEHPNTWPGTTEPFAIDEDKLLYTGHFSAGFDPALPQCGVLIDEWTEMIPARDETAGLAFHYDRPNSEPPQTLLLATPSDFTGSWVWSDLVDAVRETFALARKRAVEPSHIDQTAYARFLPAIVSSVTTYPIMHSLNFAYNNRIQFREG